MFWLARYSGASQAYLRLAQHLPSLQMDSLEAKLDEAEKKQNAYEETLACVDRLWRQLNEDVAFLATRACGGECDAAECAPPASPAAPAQPHKAENGQVGHIFSVRRNRLDCGSDTKINLQCGIQLFHLFHGASL